MWIDIGWYWGDKQKWDYVGWYSGEMYNGKPEGIGTYSWGVDGGTYTGEFRNGKMEGKGTRTFADGTKVAGRFRNGIILGTATEITPQGDKYFGKFENNLKNGRGTLTLADGSKLSGLFKDNEFLGKKSETFIENSDSERASNDTSQIVSEPTREQQGENHHAKENLGSNLVLNNHTRDVVPLTKEGGVVLVSINLNGALTLNAIVDSGASDVSIPADIVSTLYRTRTISGEDFLGFQTYILADGTKVPSARFRIRQLKIGKTLLENVEASIASAKADILLGQSFLRRFRSWSIDNRDGVIILNK